MDAASSLEFQLQNVKIDTELLTRQLMQRLQRRNLVDMPADINEEPTDVHPSGSNTDDYPMEEVHRSGSARTEGYYAIAVKNNIEPGTKMNILLGRSRIHGWGVFAKVEFETDKHIVEYVGEIIRPIVASKRQQVYKSAGVSHYYMFELDKDYIIDATFCGNIARYINHSCDPNSYAKIINDEGRKKIVIRALRKIVIGEELTLDYNFNETGELRKCLCGSSICRGYM